MKDQIDQFQSPHSHPTSDTYRYTPYGGAGEGESSSPLNPSIDPRGPFAVGRGPCLTDTHRLIDGEPDAVWHWS